MCKEATLYPRPLVDLDASSPFVTEVPTPSTLNPAPCTLNPAPCTLNRNPSTPPSPPQPLSAECSSESEPEEIEALKPKPKKKRPTPTHGAGVDGGGGGGGGVGVGGGVGAGGVVGGAASGAIGAILSGPAATTSPLRYNSSTIQGYLTCKKVLDRGTSLIRKRVPLGPYSTPASGTLVSGAIGAIFTATTSPLRYKPHLSPYDPTVGLYLPPRTLQ